jgi:hypothetical protein
MREETSIKSEQSRLIKVVDTFCAFPGKAILKPRVSSSSAVEAKKEDSTYGFAEGLRHI